MYMDGIWLRPGQAKIVPADTNYGDATVSGEGCIFLEIFGDHYGARPVSDEPSELAYWNDVHGTVLVHRSEEHTSELQSLMRNSYPVLCLKNKNHNITYSNN